MVETLRWSDRPSRKNIVCLDALKRPATQETNGRIRLLHQEETAEPRLQALRLPESHQRSPTALVLTRD